MELDNPNSGSQSRYHRPGKPQHTVHMCLMIGQASQKQSLGVNDAAPLSDTGLMFSSSGLMYSEPVRPPGISPLEKRSAENNKIMEKQCSLCFVWNKQNPTNPDTLYDF